MPRKVAKASALRPAPGTKLRLVPVGDVEAPPPPHPLRRGDEDLAELKESLEKTGQRVPILVRRAGKALRLVSGYRRLRACHELGRGQVLAIVYDELSDSEAELLYLIDNLAGLDADPLSMFRLVRDRGAEALRALTVPWSFVGPFLPLVEGPDEVRRALEEERLSLEQGAALLQSGEPGLLGEVVAEGLSPQEIRLRGEKRRLARLREEAGEEELEELAGYVTAQLAALAEKLAVLGEHREHLAEPRRRELEEGLAALAVAGRGFRDLRGEAVSLASAGGRLRQLTALEVAEEVRAAETPVLLSLQLEGQESCRLAEDALCEIRQRYAGDVKLFAADLLATELDGTPQLLKLGREFLLKSLPAVLLFWRGEMVSQSTGEIDVDDWLRVLSSWAGPLGTARPGEA